MITWEKNNRASSSHVPKFYDARTNRFVLGSKIKFGQSTRRVATCSLKITHPVIVPLPAVLLCLLYKYINSITIICAAIQCVPKRLGSERLFIKIHKFDGYPVTVCVQCPVSAKLARTKTTYNTCTLSRRHLLQSCGCCDTISFSN